MTQIHLPPEVSYPPAPWRAKARVWIALARITRPLPLPADLAAAGNPRRLLISLARFEGTLRYNELGIGCLARRGRRFGIHVHYIWVDDPASLWGGRRLWGIPKQLAGFTWDGNTISVAQDADRLVTLTLARPPRRWSPAFPLPVPAFGQIDGQRTYLPGRGRARLARTTMDITDWAAALPPLAGASGLPALAAHPGWFTFPAGRRLGTILE